MKSKVLIPVDTARNSMTAEEHAIKLKLAHASGGHAAQRAQYQALGAAWHQPGRPSSASRIPCAGGLKRCLQPRRPNPSKKSGIEYETRIEEGQPATVIICREAEDGGYDMVILPQSGFSELEEILGGSVVHNVLWKCKTPILAGQAQPAAA